MNTCTFGSQASLTRLAALTTEIGGVRTADDIEPIHRMRVAARRLRTALDLFADCAPAKRLAKWKKRIKRLAGALGAARDSDVQIEFLTGALARVPERRFRPGIQRLLLRLKQRRAEMQDDVLHALKKFESRGVAGDLSRGLTPAPGEAAADSVPELALYQRAARALSTQLQEVLVFDSVIRDPANIKELHQMRIAAKHLRYALEIFAPLYPAGGAPGEPAPDHGSALDPYVDIIKDAQEMLGDIHDCDVWLDWLPQFLNDEIARTRDYLGHTRPLKQLEPGLVYLQQERRYHRNIRYNELIDFWQAHQQVDTWGALLQLLADAAAGPSLSPALAQPDAPVAPHSARSGDPAEVTGERTEVCIALIGDIHANLPALEAVLAHARAQGANLVWNVGDLVGYGAFPDEVVRLLQREGALSISGNYDLKTLDVKRKKEKWQKTKRPERLLAFEWAYDHLSPESREYLKALPQERRLSLGGKRILLTHGSPDSNEEPLTSATPEKRLRELAHQSEVDVIISGHSHQPLARQVEGVWFINTGSVGRPDDGDPRAGYAVLRLGPETFEIQHHRVDYDTQRIATALREQGLPEAFARIFLYGRSLDDLVTEE